MTKKTKNNKKKLPLLNDYIFKRTFTKDEDGRILKDFLEAILEEKITKVEVKNSEIPKDVFDEKLSLLDIKAEIDNKKIVDIELQVGNEHNLEDRGTLYMCKNISTQIKEGDMYTKIKPSIAIWILNFNYYKRNSYHSIAKMRFEKTKKKEYIDIGYENEDDIATNDLEMHFIELPKFIKKNPGVEGKLEQWLWLIVGKEEKIKMAEKKNKEIKRARTLLDQISNDPKEQERYENKLLAEFRYKSGIEGSREFGKKQGRKEGKKEAKLEIAKNMIDKKIDLKLISEVTKINIEELKKLKEN